MKNRNGVIGGAIPLTVAPDGKVAGQTGPQAYFLREVAPGPHELASIPGNTSTLALDAGAGTACPIRQEVRMGLRMGRLLLPEVDEKAGRKGVSECKRARSNVQPRWAERRRAAPGALSRPGRGARA